jgi:hypothetical protein
MLVEITARSQTYFAHDIATGALIAATTDLVELYAKIEAAGYVVA